MVKCPRGCGRFLEFDTDNIGRVVERCPRCGPVDPIAPARAPSAPTAATPFPPAPSAPREMPAPALHHSPVSPMSYDKKCKRSGRPFTAAGRTAQFCHVCPECTAAEAAAPPQKKTPKVRKLEKKRKRIDTGFRGEPPRSTRGASSSGLAGAIAHIESEIATLDARRDQLVTARDALQLLEADAA